MDDVYVYVCDLPPGVHEMVTPCLDGYTIYVDEKLDMAHRKEAYYHALKHIRNLDFEKHDWQSIEYNSHRR